MTIYALTGGIASGKSAASRVLQSLGAHLISADSITHELLKKDSPCFAKIMGIFGSEVLDEDKAAINRPRLKNIIFNHPAKKQQLEAIIHPEVRRIMRKRALERPINELVILEIPLLKNKHDFPYIAGTIFISSDKKCQLERILARDNITESLANKIIHSQDFLQTTKENADFVLLNNGTQEAFENKVHKLFLELLI